jgi:hypothetical protein
MTPALSLPNHFEGPLIVQSSSDQALSLSGGSVTQNLSVD